MRTTPRWTILLRRFAVAASCVAILLELAVAWLRFRETGTVGWRLLFRDLASATAPLGILWWTAAAREQYGGDDPAA